LRFWNEEKRSADARGFPGILINQVIFQGVGYTKVGLFTEYSKVLTYFFSFSLFVDKSESFCVDTTRAWKRINLFFLCGLSKLDEVQRSRMNLALNWRANFGPVFHVRIHKKGSTEDCSWHIQLGPLLPWKTQ
jgi:hypothetical protein